MSGFRLKINNTVREVAVDNGIVSIVLNRIKHINRDEVNINVGGLDLEKEQDMNWLDQALSNGDVITIEVANVNESDTPARVQKHDIEDLVLEAKLKAYQALKKELESEGLL